MDWSKYPSRINKNGEKEYFFDGDWCKPVDMNNLSPADIFSIIKIPNWINDSNYTYLASDEAMIEGCYRFVEIEEAKPKVAGDVPGRFLAKAFYKEKPSDSYIDSQNRYALVTVRINPLLNRAAKGSFMDYAASEGKVIKKSIDSFKILFHKKEIHLEKIELVENLQYKNKSYVYTWHFIKSDS